MTWKAKSTQWKSHPRLRPDGSRATPTSRADPADRRPETIQLPFCGDGVKLPSESVIFRTSTDLLDTRSSK